MGNVAHFKLLFWRLGQTENRDGLRLVIPCAREFRARCWLRNIRTNGNDRRFRIIFRQPADFLERVGENGFRRSPIQLPNNPVLACAAETVNPTRPSLPVRFVEHDRYARATAAKDCDHSERCKWKSAPRPT